MIGKVKKSMLRQNSATIDDADPTGNDEKRFSSLLLDHL